MKVKKEKNNNKLRALFSFKLSLCADQTFTPLQKLQ